MGQFVNISRIGQYNRCSGSRYKKKMMFFIESNWNLMAIIVPISVGYNIGVINGPYQYIRDWCNVTAIEKYDIHLNFDELQTLWSVVISIFLIGGCIGSLAGAWFADKFGR